ncbi:hypothetical protein A2U01_0017102 [Trifolium medium]|uniref:Uncharacterized protein n=1 Tax=Trifolium medium TaxID=97028 RepID=A0A392NA49_9FABA|nr:hypothetical protein [Trifolium medium]
MLSSPAGTPPHITGRNFHRRRRTPPLPLPPSVLSRLSSTFSTCSSSQPHLSHGAYPLHVYSRTAPTKIEANNRFPYDTGTILQVESIGPVIPAQ